MEVSLLAALVGLAAGVLSGMFGVGGGVLTTPALRVLLDAPALIAVGTPLVVIIPTAVTGALAYRARGLADVQAGLAAGVWGALAAVVGAGLSALAGGTVVMLATAGLILVIAADMIRDAPGRRASEPELTPAPAPSRFALPAIGVATGLYSGFLGLGGGFVLVPLLVRWLGFPVKKAIGTSLVTIAVLAIPGSVAHGLLGHIDPALALGLVAGVVPGSLLGARLTAVASERFVRRGFVLLLVVTGLALLASEIGALT